MSVILNILTSLAVSNSNIPSCSENVLGGIVFCWRLLCHCQIWYKKHPSTSVVGGSSTIFFKIQCSGISDFFSPLPPAPGRLIRRMLGVWYRSALLGHRAYSKGCKNWCSRFMNCKCSEGRNLPFATPGLFSGVSLSKCLWCPPVLHRLSKMKETLWSWLTVHNFHVGSFFTYRKCINLSEEWLNWLQV